MEKVKENENSENSENLRHKIKNRESIAKIIIGVMLFALIFYKLAISDINFDFSNFNFSDLLSLTLAIFAIALSVAFYFKATDTSNKFYDNTFKFTKDISEILGRIEAGFGERLRHLDEGYTGLRDKFDGGVQVSAEEIESTKKELEEEKNKLKKERTEKNEILSSLMKKAKLSATEKEEVLEKLENKEKEISHLSKELHFLKRELKHDENELRNKYPSVIYKMITHFIKKENIDTSIILEAPFGFIRRKFKFNRENHPRSFYERFNEFGIIEDDEYFTTKGIQLLKDIAKRTE
jgi:Skp family chaperone for outer membrane proteins